MLVLSQFDADLAVALKSKNILAVETLRGLKARLHNERIAKQKELAEDEILAVVKSEIKRRKEAANVYQTGQRPELAKKELDEAEILFAYLPPQMDENVVAAAVDKVLAENQFTVQDFGKAMGQLKAQLGAQVDGAMLAKILKEKLK